MTHIRILVLALLLGALCLTGTHLPRAGGAEADARSQAQKLQNDGNWQEAYTAYAKLALDPQDDPRRVGEDLTNAIACLNRLGRQNEIDDFREKVIAAHAGNWRLLRTAARSFLDGDHQGYLVAGKFHRGYPRGGDARYVYTYERDRVRALQLMAQAMEKAQGETNRDELAGFYWSFAEMLLGNRGWQEAWRLQYLSDLSALPDYDEGYYGYYGRTQRGAPVQADGTPVYYAVPASWRAAQNDGERWRWALAQTAELAPSRRGQTRLHFAQFLHNQFGVQTMAGYGWNPRGSDDDKEHESGPYAVQTLRENETIARLATGIKRFTLPDEYNFITIYRQLADDTKAGQSSQALIALAEIFTNRRQYAKAEECWRREIRAHGDGGGWKMERLKQLIGHWGQFEPVMTQPAGQGATVDFRFRNGNKVSFEAQEIDIALLLADLKAYIKANPKQLDWDRLQLDNVGYQLVEKNRTKYLKGRAAAWDLALAPRAEHFDTRVTIATPLQRAGAYLLTAQMAGGNTSRIVLWVADTAIVKKQMDNKSYYYVGDAVTGAPIARANVEFFGYNTRWIDDRNGHGGRYDITTRNFAEHSGANGEVILTPQQMQENYNWIIVARQGERLAFLGFTGVWYGEYRDAEYNTAKTFVITDRPVYRPGQPVKFKFWVNHAKYDQEGKSRFAGREFSVRVNNPKGDKVFEKSFTADAYGGFDGEFTLEQGAMLGNYSISLPGPPHGGGHFRVEEYKKPEFEVQVEAPGEPVMLGEKVDATITARYYFGAPVTEATVKYKILRSSHSANWYPAGAWDWFYGPGYWWFAGDYPWYPGWGEWGCRRPVPFWWGGSHEQPEVVAESEAPIGADGTVKVRIDTALAQAIHGDRDHRYTITAEVTDQSRRTIVGQGAVLVARKPFKVYAWVNRGHYRVGDVIHGYFSAQTLDNKPVTGTGELRLLKVNYVKVDGQLKPIETEIQRWPLNTNDEGRAYQQMKAAQAGQYRLSYAVSDAAGHRMEGGYLLTVRGAGFDGSQFRFNDLELTTDKREYRPGEKVQLLINTNRPGATVLLFIRPANGVYLEPKILRLQGKSTVEEIAVTQRDMPNFFVEALTISGGKVFTETREIVVPPEKRVLNVTVTPSAEQFKPGEEATMTVKVTDAHGKPYQGSAVVSLYDKSVEYVAGGSNVRDIKEFFWKWRRSHHPRSENSLLRGGNYLLKAGERTMDYLGVFGHTVADEDEISGVSFYDDGYAGHRVRKAMAPATAAMPAPGLAMGGEGANARHQMLKDEAAPGEGGGAQPLVEPTVRSNFADTALWVAALQTDANGEATVKLTMPENLTTWKARVWAIGDGAAVGEGTAEMTTSKHLLVRLQAPRFFTQKDEVVISANVHNYLQTEKQARVVLEIDELNGASTTSLDAKIRRLNADMRATKLPGWELAKPVTVAANGEQRVDWRIRVDQPGELVIRVKALTDEESDAMEMRFPVYIHGMLKTESFSGAIRPEQQRGAVTFRVPQERLPEQSRLEVRYSPTLAGAMVDALPYLVDYPYGCTEQTLNRFLPTVLTQQTLRRMGVNLREIQQKRTNLNAQEIGDDTQRAQDWQRMGKPWGEARNPVFDEAEVNRMVQAGLERLASMQCADGGWGWFSGWGEQSYPHTTALVVHGMQAARANGVALVPGVLERGIAWLKQYQATELARLKEWEKTQQTGKPKADAMDAFVYMVLVDEKMDNAGMRDRLYRDRTELPVYAKCMFGLALQRVQDIAKRDMLIRNIEQYLVQDEENQTAYLKLPENNWWWCWYGSEYEAQAYYLKLLAATDAKSEKASRLVKYLINNRKHATYWQSTRDTAIVVEALADYLKASGEDTPNLTVEVRLDGKAVKTVKIDKSNLFSFDNKFVLEGVAVTPGEHKLELVKTGNGPLYYNAYLTNFTLEDQITRAGLEIKVERKFYKLTPVQHTVKVEGSRGQAVDQRVEKYARQELKNLDLLKSGDLVEVELEIDAKNDYEYLLFEDMKAAGFEPVEVRSGYSRNGLGAYMELRDERVCFFVRALPRGKHSISYRLRAEIPGRFSALPTKASAMYAPELKANSDEVKLRIEDI